MISDRKRKYNREYKKKQRIDPCFRLKEKERHDSVTVHIKITRKCVVCGRGFFVTKLGGNNQKTCNSDCRKINTVRINTNGSKKRRIETRASVLSIYSSGEPICACCGENNVKFLCLDHIDGDGNKHRKEMGCSIYQWLKKNNFPVGIVQVYCYNCNMANAFYGSCHD